MQSATIPFISASLLPTQINEVLTHIFPMSFNPSALYVQPIRLNDEERQNVGEARKRERGKEQKNRKQKENEFHANGNKNESFRMKCGAFIRNDLW